MNKLDHLIKLIDRLVELNEEILREIKGKSTQILTDPIDSLKARKLLDISRTTLYRKTVDGSYRRIPEQMPFKGRIKAVLFLD
ncbi:MAG: hypothetical protein ACYCZO_09795 [Daejeonella sp.]